MASSQASWVIPMSEPMFACCECCADGVDPELHAAPDFKGHDIGCTLCQSYWQWKPSDPALAEDWLNEKLAAAWNAGHERGFWNGRLSQIDVPYGAPDPLIGRNDAAAHNPYASTQKEQA